MREGEGGYVPPENGGGYENTDVTSGLTGDPDVDLGLATLAQLEAAKGEMSQKESDALAENLSPEVREDFGDARVGTKALRIMQAMKADRKEDEGNRPAGQAKGVEGEDQEGAHFMETGEYTQENEEHKPSERLTTGEAEMQEKLERFYDEQAIKIVDAWARAFAGVSINEAARTLARAYETNKDRDPEYARTMLAVGSFLSDFFEKRIQKIKDALRRSGVFE